MKKDRLACPVFANLPQYPFPVMSADTVIRKTTEYLRIPSVVGHEGPFMRYLGADFERLGYRVSLHPGLLAVEGDDPRSIVVSAHIDRHGLISLGDGEYVYAAQYVKEIKYGQQNSSSKNELENISKRFEGESVIAYDPATGGRVGEGVITSCDVCMENGDSIFYLHDMPPAPPDTPVAYARMAVDVDGYYRGQLDNTISLGTLFALCEAGFRGTILLSTEEEIGKSWRHIANWLERAAPDTENLIVIDTSPYTMYQPINEGMVILRGRDKSEIFNQEMAARIEARCRVLGIPCQFKDRFLLEMGKEIRQLGSTELGKLIAETKGRWSGATVQIPTVMYHTSYETTSRICINNYFALLKNILIEDRI